MPYNTYQMLITGALLTDKMGKISFEYKVWRKSYEDSTIRE